MLRHSPSLSQLNVDSSNKPISLSSRKLKWRWWLKNLLGLTVVHTHVGQPVTAKIFRQGGQIGNEGNGVAFVVILE